MHPYFTTWREDGTWSCIHHALTIEARVPGDGKLEVIEDAPGAYVKVRAQD